MSIIFVRFHKTFVKLLPSIIINSPIAPPQIKCTRRKKNHRKGKKSRRKTIYCLWQLSCNKLMSTRKAGSFFYLKSKLKYNVNTDTEGGMKRHRNEFSRKCQFLSVLDCLRWQHRNDVWQVHGLQNIALNLAQFSHIHSSNPFTPAWWCITNKKESKLLEQWK